MTENEYYNFLGVSGDLWTYIKKSGRPAVIYGTGNGADKIIASLREKSGVEFADVFASDEFVRGQAFCGKTVMKYSDAAEKYGRDMIVLTAFGSRLDSVIEHIYKLAGECEMYAPDVPVCGDDLFDAEFFNENISRLCSARNLLHDEKSKNIFDNIVRYKLTGRLDFLRSASCPDDVSEILGEKCAKYRKIADLGAYNGDTLRYYAELFPNLEWAAAAEPDANTFKKLIRYADSEKRFSIECHNIAVSDKTGVIQFSTSGNRGSNASEARKTTKFLSVQTDTLDNILNGKSVGFIKYDVEGAESDALKGSENTISACSPDIAVSVYHRSGDIFSLTQLLSEMCPLHKLYLRRVMCVPAWEITLYAVK